MLSNVEITVLSLINEKPSYPYEIEKQIEARNMRIWVKIGIASIYQVLERLNKKKYVEFEVEREGKAPERKRYFITAAGKAELKNSVKELLESLELYYLDLNLAIETSDILEPLEVRESLIRRLELVRLSQQKLLETKSLYTDKFSHAEVIFRNIKAFRETEEKLLTEIIAVLPQR